MFIQIHFHGIALLQLQFRQLLALPPVECIKSLPLGQSPFLFFTRRFWNLLMEKVCSLKFQNFSCGEFNNLPNFYLLLRELQARCDFDATESGQVLIGGKFTLQFQELGARERCPDSLARRVRVVVMCGCGRWRVRFRRTWVHRSFTQVVRHV